MMGRAPKPANSPAESRREAWANYEDQPAVLRFGARSSRSWWPKRSRREDDRPRSSPYQVALLDLGGDRTNTIVADRDPADVGEQVIGPPAGPAEVGLHPEDEL